MRSVTPHPVVKLDAPRGTRTRNPPLKRRVLMPVELPAHWLKAELNGLEPSSSRSTSECLTSRPQFHLKVLRVWQGVRDSNPRLRDRESRALGRTWLTPRVLSERSADGIRTRNYLHSQCSALPVELRPT